ncbi:hypothetical protein BT93_C0564 [Corymbia citriodora subsp. variegata]|nr:hypothetical protein BT93_C0564 [Corymbia citriodora subsp. variegata]
MLRLGATVSSERFMLMRYTFPDPPLPITFSSFNPDRISDSVKFNLWKGVSFRVESTPSLFFLEVLIINGTASKTIIASMMAKITTKARLIMLDLLDWELQTLTLMNELDAQRPGLFRKLASYLASSNSSGISPLRRLEDKFSRFSFSWLISGGTEPDSWFSDRSNCVSTGKKLISLGIGPEIRL